MNQVRLVGGGETIAVPVEGPDYEAAVTRSMARLSQFVEGARVVREIGDADEGTWFLSGSECHVSQGGHSLTGTFYFTRCTDEFEED